MSCRAEEIFRTREECFLSWAQCFRRLTCAVADGLYLVTVEALGEKRVKTLTVVG